MQPSERRQRKRIKETTEQTHEYPLTREFVGLKSHIKQAIISPQDNTTLNDSHFSKLLFTRLTDIGISCLQL
jgi:hypothetical protein